MLSDLKMTFQQRINKLEEGLMGTMKEIIQIEVRELKKAIVSKP